MICNNCGKQIKDTTEDKCLNCGQAISRRFEGNGFYDILSTKEERTKPEYYNEEKEQIEKMDDKLILELINTHKATNKILKKQMAFERITIILSVIFIAVSIIFLISFMRYSTKIDTLNDNLSKIHISENKEQEETNGKNEVSVTEPMVEEISYMVELVNSTEEQIQVFENGKDIKIKDSVFGQITENKDGVLTIKASIIKDGEKILLSSNTEIEIAFGQEYDFFVDGVSIKGKIKTNY